MNRVQSGLLLQISSRCIKYIETRAKDECIDGIMGFYISKGG